MLIREIRVRARFMPLADTDFEQEITEETENGIPSLFSLFAPVEIRIGGNS